MYYSKPRLLIFLIFHVTLLHKEYMLILKLDEEKEKYVEFIIQLFQYVLVHFFLFTRLRSYCAIMFYNLLFILNVL